MKIISINSSKLVLVIAMLMLGGCINSHTLPLDEAELPTNPKNVILFLGDGMGISTVTAARIYVGQSKGLNGEEYVLPFERFNNVALVKTYNTNQQVPDSAGTATAFHTGTKTRAGVINVAPQVERGDCSEALQHPLNSIGELAVEHGKSVGIVTTARITHATPASVYAHSPERDWEHNGVMPTSALDAGCKDIAQQLLDFPFDLALGGGRAYFYGQSQGGKRREGEADLVADWQQQSGGQYLANWNQAKNLDNDKPLLGLFNPSHMQYMLDRAKDSTEPTLTQMAELAINRLSQAGEGYYLLIEGGRIDHGHHEGRAGYALSETAEFANAVDKALELTNPEETLILVTADHSHVMTIAGYPTRGNPILGLVQGNDQQGNPRKQATLAADGLPYTTLNYATGPGAPVKKIREQPQHGVKATQQAIIPTLNSVGDIDETHAGEDVALYAHGVGAEQVKGVIEQNLIFDLILKGLFLGENRLK